MFRKATVTRRRRPVTFTEGEKVWARNYSHGQKWVPGIRLAKQCIKLKLSKEVLRQLRTNKTEFNDKTAEDQSFELVNSKYGADRYPL